MYVKQFAFGLLTVGLVSCNSTEQENYVVETEAHSNIRIVGEMKNVMWKGELWSTIDLDTISDKTGLYGLGPISYLTGELLINDGESYVSKVTSDSTMTVDKTFKIAAPFFVYGNVTEWDVMELPSDVKTIQELEKFIDDITTEHQRPFIFKLIGQVSTAIIHIQNLPEGTKVSSPDEAHQGQTDYHIVNEDAEIIGFFSTEHKGVFTHHDSFMHMHLVTKDEKKMGHLDELVIEKMKLYLPHKSHL